MSQPRSEKIANVFLVLISPLVMAWVIYCFWRLAMTGTLYVRADGRIVAADSGFNFWVTLGLYVILFFGALTALLAGLNWLSAKLKGDKS